MFREGSTIRRRRLWNSRLAIGGYRALRGAAERIGLQLVLKTFYSPVPDLAAQPANTWERRDPLRGIRFDLDAQMAFAEAQLSPHLAAFDRRDDVGRGHAFDPGNSSYSPADARILYAMVRHARPSLVVELGSGQTTRVIAQAVRANARDGASGRLRAFDPFPTAVDAALPGLDALVRVKAQDVPDEEFAALGTGDILCVDTTHTVKLGSDVNNIVLRVLPLLRPGVLVHFHDIFLPYEYPRSFMADFGLYWAEQYLLQAFLAFNERFDCVCAVHALERELRERFLAAGFVRDGEIGGSAFWLRRSAEEGGHGSADRLAAGENGD